MKLKYDDIKLGGKVKNPYSVRKDSPNYTGEIVSIENLSSLQGINEPIFRVKFRDFSSYFGLKYVLKNYLTV